MAKIKTRDAAKSGAEATAKVASAGDRMKRAYIRAKSHAQSNASPDQNSPEEYAADQVTQGVESIAHEGIVQTKRQGTNGLRSTKERMSRIKDYSGPTPAPKARDSSTSHAEVPVSRPEGESPRPGQTAPPKCSQRPQRPSPKIKTSPSDIDTSVPLKNENATFSAPSPTERARRWGKEKAVERSRSHRLSEKSPHTIKTVDRVHWDIKTIDCGKKEIDKSSKKSVKTAQHTAKATIKTAEQSAKAAERSARATAKAARVTAQAAQTAARTTAQGAKAAAKATASAIKAILAAAKALVSALIAGGWVALLILVFVCLIGLIVASPFGIFFSGEDSGNGQTMQMAVREINEDFQAQINTIKANTSYDAVEVSGSRAVWKEVLAVYAVKTATDPTNAQEVATMDDSKKALLKSIFWEMTTISSWTETDSSTDTELRDDGHGNMVEVEVTTTYTTLYISVSSKAADEMAAQFHFTPAQLTQLAELLAEENNALWNAVLYGIGDSDCDIVSVALSQLGNVGGDLYWSWYGFTSHVDWCACFVSWCANECGYIDAGVIPKFASCADGAAWFQGRGAWQNSTYTPNSGDIIFFDWDDEDNGQDGAPDHVGIVEQVSNGYVHTIEGNSGDSCQQRQYAIGNYEIYGYGIPSY